jgi:hypothetical protein
VRVTSEFGRDPTPWGGHQPKFEHLATEGTDRYFLIGREASGEPIRVQLLPGRVEGDPDD